MIATSKGKKKTGNQNDKKKKSRKRIGKQTTTRSIHENLRRIATLQFQQTTTFQENASRNFETPQICLSN